MRILIVDDSIEKISELSKYIFELFPNVIIDTAENVSNSILLLKSDKYDLAIIDLLLPLRNNEEPKNNGGKILVDEIYRIKEIVPPTHIIGFTQLKSSNLDFSKIWNIIEFSYENVEWKSSINQLLFHINKSKINSSSDTAKKPTIFVEGLTDKYYLECALDLFYPDYSEKISIISQKNAGANWVATQISLWAMKLEKVGENGYLKAVGLLDSDEAGNIAKRKVEQRNLSDNEKSCCSYHQLKPNYNINIIPFYKEKCKIEIEIESLFPEDILFYAESQNWLEHKSSTFTEIPRDWNQFTESTSEYLKRKNFLAENLIYIRKIKIQNKQDFSKYIESLDNHHLVFKNFEILLNDLLQRLNLK